MEGFLTRGWDSILPGRHWLHESQLLIDQPMGSGFPHCMGWYRRGEPLFLSPVGRIFRGTEGFPNQGGVPIPPSCGGTSMPLLLEYPCSAPIP